MQLYAKMSVTSRTAVKNLFVLLSAAFAMSAMAQASDWKLTTVPGYDKGTVGYIYHTSAVGTAQTGSKTEKYVTGLRLVCSASDVVLDGNKQPVIAIFWDRMIGSMPQNVEVKVDGSSQEIRWDQDGTLLLRSVSESKALIQSMKTGNKISFQWTASDSVRRTTMFDLRTFRSDLSEFNKVCKTQI